MSDKTYIHYGTTKFNKKLFKPIKNRPGWAVKPIGGFWASPVKTERGWKDWNEAEEFARCDEENSFKFKLAKSAKVLFLEFEDDLENLPKIEEKTYEGDSICLDFEKLLTNGVDAIEIKISYLYFTLYGWDCDSILILNPDVIKEIKE